MRPCKKSAISTLTVYVVIAVLAAPMTIHAQGKAYTLKECIDKALKTDLTVVQARNGVKQAKADVRSAWGAFLPDLNFTLDRSFDRTNYSRVYDYWSLTVRDTSYSANSHFFNVSLSSRMTLFDGFGQFTYLAWTKADLRASRHQVTQSELSAVYNVRSQYFLLLQAQAQRNISEKAMERSQELMKIAETKYELGSASLSDVLKAKVSLSEAQLELLKAENAVKMAQAKLAYLIGEQVDLEIVVADIEVPEADYSMDQIKERALQNNPEYLYARANLNSSRFRVRYAQRNYLPSVTLSVSRNWDRRKSDQWKDFSWGKDDGIYVRGNISFNIFNRFATMAETDYAKANLHTAEYEVSDSKRDLELKVREAYLGLQESMKARELSEEKLASAQEDYKLAQEKYTLGAATILDILDAEVSLRTAESDQVDSKYNYLLAIARLKTVMGIIE